MSRETKKFENHCYTISQCMYICVYHNSFSHSIAEEQWIILQFLVIVGKVAMDIFLCMSF